MTHTQANFLADFLQPFHFELERCQKMVYGTLTQRFGGYSDGPAEVDDVVAAVVGVAQYTHLAGFRGCAMISYNTKWRRRRTNVSSRAISNSAVG